jgi:N-acetylglucosamine kinase-like BadF-type ATPase
VTQNHPGAAAHLVGVDVGGTKTHVRLLDTDGAEEDLVLPSSAWRSGELFADPENLPRLAGVLLRLRPLAEDAVVVLGVHGCDTPAQMREATLALSRHLGRPVTVVNDAELLGFAEQEEPSIQMIVGTGAVICGSTADGARITVDGHGWPLGDRGSAHDLVSTALRETLVTCDRGVAPGGGASDPLIGAVLTAFGASDAATLAAEATRIAGGAAWGAFAPLVFEQAAAGSALAGRIVEDAARALATGVASLVRRGAIGSLVVAGGGVIVNQPAYERRIRERLAEEAPQLGFVVVRRPPVVGAMAHARALAAADRTLSEVAS